MQGKIFNLGEKSEEYPHGYGYCQCGCGKIVTKLSNGLYLHFKGNHRPRLRVNRKNKSTAKPTNHTESKRIRFFLKNENDKWSDKYDKCIGCGTNKIGHWARGYCERCYPKYIIRKTGYFNRDDKGAYRAFIQKIRPKLSARLKTQRNLPVKINERLNKELLEELYHKKQMSLGDIASQFDCSRIYVYRLCLKYGIKVKTKSEARRDAYSTGKKLRYHPVNINFFKKWSNEMVYVLGFIFADGNIDHRLTLFSVSQKEIEILEKIKNLLQAEQNITHYKHQDIYHLTIGSVEMVMDLLKLGVSSNKSLKIKFPNMPLEYVSHLIRGYFDGDGTICKQGNGWKASIVSGSKDFIESIRSNLEKFAGVTAQKIYKHKDANAYYLAYHSRDDLNKVFRFFYDDYTLSHDLYLTRKHLKFKKATESFDNWSSKQLAASKGHAK